MNKLISLKDQDNNLINKQCVGIDTSNVLANLNGLNTYTATQDCFVTNTNGNTYIDNATATGSLRMPNHFFLKKGQSFICSSACGGYANVYGLKYL